MTLRRQDLSDRIYRRLKRLESASSKQQYLFKELSKERITRARSRQILNQTFNLISSALQSGEDVIIPGFGRFPVRFKWARKGRDPVTGKSILLPPRKVISFKYSSRLRRKLNQQSK